MFGLRAVEPRGGRAPVSRHRLPARPLSREQSRNRATAVQASQMPIPIDDAALAIRDDGNICVEDTLERKDPKKPD
jgi:hypothetical protein